MRQRGACRASLPYNREMIFLLLSMQATPVQPAAWPAITETELHIGIPADGSRIGFWFPVKAADGRPLYLFSCDGGSAGYMDSISTDSIIYVPDMMCLLNEGTSKIEWSLLAEGGEAPWHTRGQFRWNDLVGDCGLYPEYGRTRHFSLRGMRITLRASDLELSHGQLSHFTLDISVKNDPGASSSRSAPSGYLYPGDDCSTVKRGVEPAYCRNQEGSYEPCTTP